MKIPTLLLAVMMFALAPSVVHAGGGGGPVLDPHSLNELMTDIVRQVVSVEESVTGGGSHAVKIISSARNYARKAQWLPTRESEDCFELQGWIRELWRLVDLGQQQGLGGNSISEARRIAGKLDKLHKDHCQGPAGDAAQSAWGKVTDRIKGFRRDPAPVEIGWIQAYVTHSKIGFPGQPQMGGGLQPRIGAAAFVLAGTLLLPEVIAAWGALHPEWLEQALAY